MTYGDVAKLWTEGDLRRRFPDLVLPIVRDVPFGSFTLAHARQVMERLPGTLSKSTRKHVAMFLRRVLSFAVYLAVPELHVHVPCQGPTVSEIVSAESAPPVPPPPSLAKNDERIENSRPFRDERETGFEPATLSLGS